MPKGLVLYLITQVEVHWVMQQRAEWRSKILKMKNLNCPGFLILSYYKYTYHIYANPVWVGLSPINRRRNTQDFKKGGMEVMICIAGVAAFSTPHSSPLTQQVGQICHSSSSEWPFFKSFKQLKNLPSCFLSLPFHAQLHIPFPSLALLSACDPAPRQWCGWRGCKIASVLLKLGCMWIQAQLQTVAAVDGFPSPTPASVLVGVEARESNLLAVATAPSWAQLYMEPS